MPTDLLEYRDNVRQLTGAAMTGSEKRLVSEQGEYKLGKLIGRGGMGKVFEVTREGLLIGARVVKLLHPPLALAEDACERLIKEGQIAFQIIHPNLVTVTDIGMFGDAPFIVMERVDGVNLRDFLAAVPKPLALDVADFTIGEAAAGLAALHDYEIGGRDAGVVHSDVTPGNIMISSNGRVKVTDFGIARFAHDDATRSRPIGTPSYMSPEQRMGKTPRKTDIFSLGMIYWELLAGGDTRYLADLDDLQRTHALLNGYIPPFTRPGIPEHSAMLCRRMLSPDPNQRPMAREVRQILIKMRPGYQEAEEELVALYKTHIGPKRTGMTKLLNTADFFGRPPESSPIKITLDSAFSAPDVPPSERTVADGGEDDAPAVFRRNRTSPVVPQADGLHASGSGLNSSRPGDRAEISTRVTSETGTANPRRLGLFEPPRSADQEPPSLLPPLLVHEPEPEPIAAHLQPSPAPVPDSAPCEPEPEVEATIVLDPPFAEASQPEPAAVPIEQPATTSQPISVGFPAAPVTEVRGRNVALWVLAGSVGLLVIAVVVLVVVLVSADRRDETTATTPPPAAEQVSVKSEGEGDPVVDPPVVDPRVVDPRVVDPPVDETGPKVDSGAAETTNSGEATTSSEEKLDGGPPPIVDPPAPKPDPKPKTTKVKKTTVAFAAPQKAEIKVGKTKKVGTLIQVELALGSSHEVSWRALPEGSEYKVGKLEVTQPPEGKAHLIRLSPTGMKFELATQGSGK